MSASQRPLEMAREIRIFTSARSRRTTLAYLAIISILFVGVSVLLPKQFPVLTDANALREYVQGYGLFAPVVFVLLQAGQVVLAPIPGQLLAFGSGYLFGPVYGTLYSVIGATLGSYVAFSLARRFGRPYVEKVVRVETLGRFDALVGRRGLIALFFVFMIPGLPDDVICFVGGLTEMDIRKMVAVSFLGRLPAYFLINLAGAQLAADRFVQTGLIVGFLLVLSAWGYLKRDALLRRFAR
ncbi:TVP38/TMEM64 family protein [Haladaptatus sp. NG-SE-30]